MVFLGGTCNGSRWRQKFIELLSDDVTFFDPTAEDWGIEDRIKEDELRHRAVICVFVLTPKMRGVYSIAQLTEESCNRPGNTGFCILENDEEEVFPDLLKENLNHTADLWEEKGCLKFVDLQELANWVNNLVNK